MRFPLTLLACVALPLASCATSNNSPTAVPAKHPQSIFLVGRFGAPYGKEQLSTHLRKMGFDVRTQMSSEVALVLVGNNPINEVGDGFIDVAATDDYRSAIANGASLLHLKDLANLVAGPAGEFTALGAQPNNHNPR